MFNGTYCGVVRHIVNSFPSTFIYLVMLYLFIVKNETFIVIKTLLLSKLILYRDEAAKYYLQEFEEFKEANSIVQSEHRQDYGQQNKMIKWKTNIEHTTLHWKLKLE